MQNKRILIVNPYWDTLGGGERYVSTLARHLILSGWSVDILWPEDFSSRIMSRFGIDLSGVCWLDQKYSPALSAGYRILFWLSDGSLPVSFSKKTIIHLQFPFKNIRGRSVQNLLKSRLYSFVVNSGFTKKYIDAEFAVNSRVIYPPVDVSAFSPGKKEKMILYVGRFSQLTQAKGQHVLIDAFRQIHSVLPEWKLVLAGGISVGADPSLMAKLSEKAKDLPVRLMTDPSFRQITNLYSRARIFWSASGYGMDQNIDPTRVEHFGITVVEAMASGCVPIITGLGGHPEIVDHGQNGYLWTDISELVELTVNTSKDPHVSVIAKNARQKSKIFDVSVFNQKFSEIIS